MEEVASPADTESVAAKDPVSEPAVVFNQQACERATGSDCARCQVACPAHAITVVPEGVHVDAGACNGCCICVAVCDAFSSTSVTTYDFAQRIKRKADTLGDVVLCCNEDVFEGLNPDRNVVAVPCLSSLSAEFLAYLLAHGCKISLAHDKSYCSNCETGGAFGPKLWERAFELAQEWAGTAIEARADIPEAKDYLGSIAAPNRRELFTNTFEAAADVATGRYRERTSSTIDNFLARRERQRAAMLSRKETPVYLDDHSKKTAEERRFARKMLLKEAIEKDPSIAERMNAH